MNAMKDSSVKVSVQGAESDLLQNGLLKATYDIAKGTIENRVEWATTRDWVWPRGEKGLLTSFNDVGDIDDYVLPLVEKREVVIQAGGACGVFPKYLSRLFEFVYTFEPSPELFQCLSANCQEQNVFKMQAALSNGIGITGSQLVCGKEKYENNRGAWYTQAGGPIPTLYIDAIGLQALDLIYLDIEGAEHAALSGATETIEEFRPVIVVEDKESTRRGAEPWIPNWTNKMNYEIAGTFKRDVILVPK